MNLIFGGTGMGYLVRIVQFRLKTQKVEVLRTC